MTAAHNLRGILLMVASMAAFALEDMFIKFAAVGLPTGEIVLISGIFGAPFFGWLAARSGRSIWVRGALHPAVLLRAAGEMVGTLAYITALATVPLPTVSAVLQVMPLAVTLGAALFLQAPVGWRRWTAIAVGLAGVMLVIRPGFDGFQPAALWVLISVAGLAARDLATRVVPPDFSDAQISSWGLMAVTALGAGMMIVTGQHAVPDVWQSAGLAGMVIVGAIGYWAITAASRTGEVSVVAPFRYTRLVFAITIGFTVFAEPVDLVTALGAALIIGSGLYSFARERARSKTRAKAQVAAKPAAPQPAS
jgi:drug/metabolite transporter (DMT)-like permease